MGDRLGTPGAVGKLFQLFVFLSPLGLQLFSSLKKIYVGILDANSMMGFLIKKRIRKKEKEKKRHLLSHSHSSVSLLTGGQSAYDNGTNDKAVRTIVE